MAKFEELYLKWVRRLHMVIPCAALLPAFYIMISFGDSDGSPRILELLYVTCLLQLFLLIPVWLIYLAQVQGKVAGHVYRLRGGDLCSGCRSVLSDG